MTFFFKFLPPKLPLKVAHNATRPVFSQASFCFVQLRQFYSLKFSHLWSCQTLQDEKIAWNFYDAGTIAFYYAVLNYLYSGPHMAEVKMKEQPTEEPNVENRLVKVSKLLSFETNVRAFQLFTLYK